MNRKVKDLPLDLDALAAHAFKRFWRDLPPSWREGGSRAVGGEAMHPHIGAQWLLKRRVADKLVPEQVDNPRAYVLAILKNEILDERKEETQFGFSVRNDGRNRQPKTGNSLGLGFGESGPEEIRGGAFPLSVSPFTDPLAAVCRMQLLEHVEHWRDGYSKPTARKHLRAGAAPDDYIIETPYWPNTWREPPDVCCLVSWEWLPEGRWHRWNWSAGKGKRTAERDGLAGRDARVALGDHGQPRTRDTEFIDPGTWLDPAKFEGWNPDGRGGVARRPKPVRGRALPWADDWSKASDPAMAARVQPYTVPRLNVPRRLVITPDKRWPGYGLTWGVPVPTRWRLIDLSPSPATPLWCGGLAGSGPTAPRWHGLDGGRYWYTNPDYGTPLPKAKRRPGGAMVTGEALATWRAQRVWTAPGVNGPGGWTRKPEPAARAGSGRLE